MLQKVNTVLVGKFPASYTTVDALNVGEIAMFDNKGALITSKDGVKASDKVRFGLVDKKISVTLPNGTLSTKNAINYSQFIDRNRVTSPSTAVVPYSAATQDVYTLNFSGVTVSEDARYAIKLVYRDLSQYKFQVTKTYDFYAVSGTTAANLAAGLVKAINSDKERRVSATLSTSTITLTALPVNDNEGKNAINEYSQVSMDVYAYKTVTSTFIYYKQIIPTGLVVTKTSSSDPGTGNPRLLEIVKELL